MEGRREGRREGKEGARGTMKGGRRDDLLDGATEAAVAQLEPLFNLLTFLTDCQGFLDIGS